MLCWDESRDACRRFALPLVQFAESDAAVGAIAVPTPTVSFPSAHAACSRLQQGLYRYERQLEGRFPLHPAPSPFPMTTRAGRISLRKSEVGFAAQAGALRFLPPM